MSIQNANIGSVLLRNSHLNKRSAFTEAERRTRGLEGDTTVSVPRIASCTTEGDRAGELRMDLRAAVIALAGNIRQQLQVIITARYILAHRPDGELETNQLALIQGAVMKLAGTLDLIGNILRSWEHFGRADGEPISPTSTPVDPAL